MQYAEIDKNLYYLELNVFYHGEHNFNIEERVMMCGGGGHTKADRDMIISLIIHQKKDQIFKIISENQEIQNIINEYKNRYANPRT